MAVVAAIGLAAGLAQTLFSALQTQEVKDMCSMFGCATQLQKLKNTMSTIENLFRDIDAKRQGLTHGGQDWIEKLKDAVYDVDDLLDEFRTIVELRKQNKDANFRRKVGEFFSRNNKFFVNFNVSRETKMLTENLAAITKDHKHFSLKEVFVDNFVIRNKTCSASKLEIIGREDDKEAIVCNLLSDNPSQRNFSFMSIVGVGGMGKTTLAQLVYNDHRVIEAFSQRIWVCVSEVSEEFNLEQILSKILKKQAFDLEQAQGEVREHLKGKRYLLVLDDVWIERPEEWSNLKPFLDSDVSGSKVIVTTRSKTVATSIRDDFDVYELKGLSQTNSWSLFKLMAFGKQTEDHELGPDLVSIGKEIVKSCANVPLSIRVIASLLYQQEKNIWLSFRENALEKLSRAGDENSIMSTLMFSYYQLTPQLKSCFSFCSLFPKDHILKKEFLINLWLAQGYLVPTNNAQSMEDVGEHYIKIMLNRCFFQDVELNDHGDVDSFKMHDLMHDLALEVAGNESLVKTLTTENPSGGKIRHLSRELGDGLCLSDKLRTYLWLDDDFFCSNYYAEDSDEVTSIVSNCKRLRVLSLPNFGIGCSLPNTVGKLLHLRYLGLSNNRLEMLPKSITKLHNLQTLILQECRDLKELPEDLGKLVNMRTLDISDCGNLKELSKDISKLVKLRTLDISGCKNLKELPDDFSKLVNLWTLDASGCSNLKELPEDMSQLINLRMLDISGCNKLTYMPRGMRNLRNLQRLSDFVVGGVDVKQIEGSNLEDLQAPLRSLIGDLRIRILYFSLHNMPRATNIGFILKNARLRCLSIECEGFYDNENEFDQSEVHETLIEDLCPNEDICEINLWAYKGTKMPSWALSLEYSDMNGVQHVTSLSRFRYLRKLVLRDLPNVEYIMEIENDGAWESRTTLFFPVLEDLELREIPKLKGWWRGLRWREMNGGGGCLADDNGREHALAGLPCFPQLRALTIWYCNSMTYFPPCPHVKDLYLNDFNEALTYCMKGGASSSNVSIALGNARVMNRVLLSEFAEGGVTDITLRRDKEVKSIGGH